MWNVTENTLEAILLSGEIVQTHSKSIVFDQPVSKRSTLENVFKRVLFLLWSFQKGSLFNFSLTIIHHQEFAGILCYLKENNDQGALRVAVSEEWGNPGV